MKPPRLLELPERPLFRDPSGVCSGYPSAASPVDVEPLGLPLALPRPPGPIGSVGVGAPVDLVDGGDPDNLVELFPGEEGPGPAAREREIRSLLAGAIFATFVGAALAASGKPPGLRRFAEAWPGPPEPWNPAPRCAPGGDWCDAGELLPPAVLCFLELPYCAV